MRLQPREAGAPRHLGCELFAVIGAGSSLCPRIVALGCANTIAGLHAVIFSVEAGGINALQHVAGTHMCGGSTVTELFPARIHVGRWCCALRRCEFSEVRPVRQPTTLLQKIVSVPMVQSSLFAWRVPV